MQPLQTADGQTHAGVHAGSCGECKRGSKLVDCMGQQAGLLSGAALTAAAVQGGYSQECPQPLRASGVSYREWQMSQAPADSSRLSAAAAAAAAGLPPAPGSGTGPSCIPPSATFRPTRPSTASLAADQAVQKLGCTPQLRAPVGSLPRVVQEVCNCDNADWRGPHRPPFKQCLEWPGGAVVAQAQMRAYGRPCGNNVPSSAHDG